MDGIYPASVYCACCDNIIDRSRMYGLCDNCIESINWANDKTCNKCGKIIDGYWQGELCADCMNISHDFDRGITCSEYSLHTRQIIFDFKYNEKTYLATDIAKTMRDRLMLEELEYDMIIPVPISKQRLKKRGFNQAYLIGKELSGFVGKPCKEILIRKKDTAPQRGVAKIDRHYNLKDAFAVKPMYKNIINDASVILLDDIYTTGSTADECSRVLKKSGVKSICILTFAAGGNRHWFDNQ